MSEVCIPGAGPEHVDGADGEQSGETARRGHSVRQRTLKSSIQCTGTALHSGAKVTMTLHPAAPDSGIVFRRTDIGGRGACIPARWENVTDTRMCTTIGQGAVHVATIEHLMAALAGCEIDNAVIELSGGEVPVMDGSAEPFVFLIECAGTVEQDAPRRGIRVLRPVSVHEDDRFVSLVPDDVFSVSFEIDFDSPAVARQECTFRLVNGTFKSDICRARTFGFLHEVDQLLAAGLARGGSLDNAVVVSGDRILNEGGLRYANEFVRHKVLDSIGDLYLAGGPVIGHFHGRQSGHALNNRLLRALFSDPANWAMAEIEAAPALAAAEAARPVAAADKPRSRRRAAV
jgi:UDP-3-O-[3-hydroxymyristoyl] N-acetylglucosamine deacetylase